MHTLYSMQNSGNCYKLRLAMALLGVPFEIVDVDVLGGETRKPEFLAINPNGRVPTLKLADGRILPEFLQIRLRKSPTPSAKCSRIGSTSESNLSRGRPRPGEVGFRFAKTG